MKRMELYVILNAKKVIMALDRFVGRTALPAGETMELIALNLLLMAEVLDILVCQLAIIKILLGVKNGELYIILDANLHSIM